MQQVSLSSERTEGMTDAIPHATAVWPDAVAYREAVQHLPTALTDPTLRTADVALDRLGLPLTHTGRFAVVFRLRDTTGSDWALRCFTSPAAEEVRRQRYEAIARHLARPSAESVAQAFVPFRYLSQGVRVTGGEYPALTMRWAPGEPLGRFVERHAETDPDALLRLCRSLDTLLRALEAAEIAHGDWQHDNLFVAEDGARVTLVDYDGVWVPELKNVPVMEAGHPNYQHPRRRPEEGNGPGSDRFSFLVIQTALVALAADPTLWRTFGNDGESLLFKAKDLASPADSALFAALHRLAHSQPAVAAAVTALERACSGPPSELCAGPPPVSIVEHLPRPSRRKAEPRSSNTTAEAVLLAGKPRRWKLVFSLGRRHTALRSAPTEREISEQARQRIATAWRIRGRERFYSRRHRRRLRFLYGLLVGMWLISIYQGMSWTALLGQGMMIACLLTLSGFMLWPRRRAVHRLKALMAENLRTSTPIKKRLAEGRGRLKTLQDDPVNRSAVTYVARELRRVRISEICDTLKIPTAESKRLLLSGIVTLEDLPPALTGPAGAVSEPTRQLLYRCRQDLIQSAREAYDILAEERRRLQREIDDLTHVAEGLQREENELSHEIRSLGDTGWRPFVAQLFVR